MASRNALSSVQGGRHRAGRFILGTGASLRTTEGYSDVRRGFKSRAQSLSAKDASLNAIFPAIDG